MTQDTLSCDREALSLLLDANENSDLFRRLAPHVEACATCQNRLTELSADADHWRLQQTALKSMPEDAPSAAFLSRIRMCEFELHHKTSFDDAAATKLLSPPSHPEMLGRLGRYEVERMIGSGGMGVVFKAYDSELHRPVAIKVLAPLLAGNGPARKRFAREARAAAAVVHEHVVPIHNVETEGESPFLVMHYVGGESLQGRLDREGALEVCEILRIGMQAAAGLAAAHAQGLVHRDVKPSNILLERGVERALITDFGLARAVDDASLTHTGYHPGTPQYMSPEQARGDSIDARSDLFSLGSVLYAMCTGRPPFRAESSYGILRRITDTEPRSIREINTDIPDWLHVIVRKLMARKVDDRFGSAKEVAELLEACLAHMQQPTKVPLPESLVTKTHSPGGVFCVRRRGVFVMAGLLGVALCGVMFWQTSEPPDISGEWTSDEWGTVVLQSKSPGRYEGTMKNAVHTMGMNPHTAHTDEVFQNKFPHLQNSQWQGIQCNKCHEGTSGTIKIKWSRLERRFNGEWLTKDQKVTGKLSVRSEGEQLRGAWTTKKDSDANHGTPKLADLVWKRNSDASGAEAGKLPFQSIVESLPAGSATEDVCTSTVPPNITRILRELAQQRRLKLDAIYWIYEDHKDSFRIIVSPVYDKRVPAQEYPLIGRASLHLLRYECTVEFTQTPGVEWPLTKDGKPETEITFYVDSDHLHREDDKKQNAVRTKENSGAFQEDGGILK